MKRYFLALLFTLWLVVLPTSVHAIACGTGAGTCFAIATGNWNAGASWSDTSGGASCSATCTVGPVAGDDVFLNGASGAITSTISASQSMGSVDFNGFTGTLAYSGSSRIITLNGAGSFKLLRFASGMTTNTPTSGSGWTFTHTTGTANLTSAGKTLGDVTLNGTGGTVQLQDNLTTGFTNLNNVTVTLGTLDVNSKSITASGFACANSANAIVSNAGVTLTVGAGGFVISGTACSATLTSTTIVVIDVNGSSANIPVTLSNKAIGTLTINANTSTNSGPVSLTFSTGNTVATMNVAGPRALSIGGSATLNITNTFAWTGPLVVRSTLGGAVATLAVNAGTSTIASGSAAMISDIAISGGTVNATGYDLGHNTGINISAPSSGSGGGIIGG